MAVCGPWQSPKLHTCPIGHRAVERRCRRCGRSAKLLSPVLRGGIARGRPSWSIPGLRAMTGRQGRACAALAKEPDTHIHSFSYRCSMNRRVVLVTPWCRVQSLCADRHGGQPCPNSSWLHLTAWRLPCAFPTRPHSLFLVSPLALSTTSPSRPSHFFAARPPPAALPHHRLFSIREAFSRARMT